MATKEGLKFQKGKNYTEMYKNGDKYIMDYLSSCMFLKSYLMIEAKTIKQSDMVLNA